MYLDKKKKIIPTILLFYILFLLLGAGIIQIKFEDKEYKRRVDDDVLSFNAMQWRNYFLEGVIFAVIALLIAKRWALPVIPCVIGLIGWALHYLGGMTDWYHYYEWWDHLTHGMAHIFFVLFLIFLYETVAERGLIKIAPLYAMITILIISIGLGAISELREYSFSLFFSTIDQGGYHNTMLDLAWNFIGGSLAMFYYVLSNIRFNPTSKGIGTTKKRFEGKSARNLLLMLLVLIVIDFFLILSWIKKVEKYDQLWASVVEPSVLMVRNSLRVWITSLT